MSRKDSLRNLIITHQRRLQKLKEQKASLGISTPPEILTQIEDIEAEIEELQVELDSLGDAVEEEEALSPLTEESEPVEQNPRGSNTYNMGDVKAAIVNQGGTQNFTGDMSLDLDFSEPKTETKVEAGGTLVQGDQLNLSGNFQGANIKSTLENVTQIIDAAQHIDQSDQEKLMQLLEQLNEALQQTPVDKGDEAEAVAQLAKSLVETAAQETPNKPMLQVTATGLKQAAENLAKVVPTVLPIATEIAVHIAKIMG